MSNPGAMRWLSGGGRRRHRFQDAPDWAEFQRRFAVRRLYRQFLRLLRTQKNDSDAIQQVRTEFRKVPTSASQALVEGQRRYREVERLLPRVPVGTERVPPATAAVWPWNTRGAAAPITLVAPFPPKSSSNNHGNNDE